METVEGPGTVQHVGASSTLLPRPILHDNGAAHVQDPAMESVLLMFDEPVKVLEGIFRKQDVDSDFGVRRAVVPRLGARPRLEMPRGLSKPKRTPLTLRSPFLSAPDMPCSEVGFAPLIFDFDVEAHCMQSQLLHAQAGSGFFQIYIWRTEISGENVTVEAVFIKEVQLSAVAASLPTGVPLALFLVACKPDTSQATLAEFSESVVRGAAGTLAFAVAMVLVVRAGFGMVAMLVCGYAAWFVTWCSLSFLMAPHAGKAE
ncbi:unnamed protein product [Symbiodinium sp. CCMP2592]|nr:unnamed protein product [Symbiodinium sp. CCMP2592]